MKGIVIDEAKWKSSKFTYTNMRDRSYELEDEEPDHDTAISKAAHSKANTAAKLTPKSFKAASKSALNDTVSDDHIVPLLGIALMSQQHSIKPQFRKFRLNSGETDADDEAEDGSSGLASSKYAPRRLARKRRENLRRATADRGSERDGGQAADEDDQGLGEGLAKISLKRKHNRVEEESPPVAPATTGASGSEATRRWSTGQNVDSHNAEATVPTAVAARSVSEQMRKKVKADKHEGDIGRQRSVSEAGVEGSQGEIS